MITLIALIVGAFWIIATPVAYTRYGLRGLAQIQQQNKRNAEARARGEWTGLDTQLSEMPNTRRGMFWFCGTLGVLFGACLGLLSYLIILAVSSI